MIRVVPELDKKYIRGTEKGAIVQDVRMFLCHLTKTVSKRGLGINQNKTRVYVSTRVLKHVYDKRSAEEYDFLINHIHTVTKYPDFIYKNKPGKRGDFCFVKAIKNKNYFCCIENVDDETSKALEIVTFYRVQKEKYLENYKLLWGWRDDRLPHRSTFDSGQRPA